MIYIKVTAQVQRSEVQGSMLDSLKTCSIQNQMHSSSSSCRTPGAIAHKSGVNSLLQRRYEDNNKAINLEL
jgi:hypothetical protein